MATKGKKNNDISASDTPPEFTDLDTFKIEEDFKGSFDQDVVKFLQDSNLADSGYIVYVYKFIGGSGSPREQCIQFNNEIKSKHEIGLMFGSGRYEIQIVGTDSSGKRKSACRKFILHPHYDNLMDDAKKLPATIPGSVPLQTTVVHNQGIGESLNIMKELITLMLPLMAAKQSTGENFPAMMKDTYKIMNENMMSNMRESTKFFNEMQRSSFDTKLDGYEEGVDDEKEDVTSMQKMIEMVAPIMEKFLPLILGKNQVAQETVGVLKSFPQYRDAVKSKKTLLRLISYLDKNKGKDITNKLLKKLGLTRPK